MNKRTTTRYPHCNNHRNSAPHTLLNSCSVFLNQGRFSYRNNSVLQHLLLTWALPTPLSNLLLKFLSWPTWKFILLWLDNSLPHSTDIITSRSCPAFPKQKNLHNRTNRPLWTKHRQRTDTNTWPLCLPYLWSLLFVLLHSLHFPWGWFSWVPVWRNVLCLILYLLWKHNYISPTTTLWPLTPCYALSLSYLPLSLWTVPSPSLRPRFVHFVQLICLLNVRRPARGSRLFFSRSFWTRKRE